MKRARLSPVSVDHVIRAASRVTNVAVEEIGSPSKSKITTHARQMAIAAAYELTGQSEHSLAARFQRDRSAINHAIDAVAKRCESVDSQMATYRSIVDLARRLAEAEPPILGLGIVMPREPECAAQLVREIGILPDADMAKCRQLRRQKGREWSVRQLAKYFSISEHDVRIVINEPLPERVA